MINVVSTDRISVDPACNSVFIDDPNECCRAIVHGVVPGSILNTSSECRSNGTVDAALDQVDAHSSPDAQESYQQVVLSFEADAKGYGLETTPHLERPLKDECCGNLSIEPLDGSMEHACMNKCDDHDRMTLCNQELPIFQPYSAIKDGDEDISEILLKLGQLFDAVSHVSITSIETFSSVTNFVVSENGDNSLSMFRNDLKYGRYETHVMTEGDVRRAMHPMSVNLLCFDSLEAATGFITTSLSECADPFTEIVNDSDKKDYDTETNITICESKNKFNPSLSYQPDRQPHSLTETESNTESMSSLESILSSLFIYEHKLGQRNCSAKEYAFTSDISHRSPPQYLSSYEGDRVSCSQQTEFRTAYQQDKSSTASMPAVGDEVRESSSRHDNFEVRL